MKKSALIFILAFSAGFHQAYAQEQDTNKVTSARVLKISAPAFVDGYLYQLRDSAISLSSSPLLSSPGVIFHDIEVRDIQKIVFRINRGAGKRFLTGALAGFAFGGIVGLAGGGTSGTFSSTSPGEDALMAGIVFGIIGGTSYAVAGSKVTIRINGNRETYLRKNRKLKKNLLPVW